MQFKAGDFVVHPIYGVGHIVNVEKKEIFEIGERLYYRLMLPKRTIWIPEKTHAEIKLRLATPKSDLDQYRNLLKSPPISLPKNHYRRQLELTNRLKQGSFQVVCEVVRDLTAWGWRKPLNPTDKTILQKTRQNLYQEWVVAAGLSMAEAVKEVDSLLRATQLAILR